MDDVRFMYQTSEKYPDKVAVMASFVPTFTDPDLNDKIAFSEGSSLEEQEISPALDLKYLFIFLIDRSGSMGQDNRM